MVRLEGRVHGRKAGRVVWGDATMGSAGSAKDLGSPEIGESEMGMRAQPKSNLEGGPGPSFPVRSRFRGAGCDLRYAEVPTTKSHRFL